MTIRERVLGHKDDGKEREGMGMTARVVMKKEGARLMTARRRVCRKTGTQEESGAGKEIWIWANVLFC